MAGGIIVNGSIEEKVVMNDKAKDLRWGKNARQNDSDMGRIKLLKIARECFSHSGIDKFRMSELSAAASVSRSTLYNYFPRKEDVLLGVLELESEELLDNLRAELRPSPRFCDYVLDCLMYIIRNQLKQPCFHTLVGSRSALVGQLYRSSTRVHRSWHELLDGPYQQGLERGEISQDVNLNSLLSWFSRLALSYAQYPAEQTDEKLRSELERFLVLGIKPRS